MVEHIPSPRWRTIATPYGPFILMRSANGAVSAHWRNLDGASSLGVEDPTLLPDLAARLERYFAGEAVEFDDVPTPQGPTFHRRCWEACRAIPPGERRTYAQLAALAGSPGAARAAGQAMRGNPLPVIVPCHRIVGSDGSLHGYAGTIDSRSTALRIKRALLELEHESLLTLA